MVTSSSPAKDAAATRERILDALGKLLARHGFAGVGVNAIAREARVDKVLIYRYFGGLPELLQAFAERSHFFPSQDDSPGVPAAGAGGPSAADFAVTMLREMARTLRARPVTQAVMRWELSASNPLTKMLGDARERRGVEMLAAFPRQSVPPDVDLEATAAVLSAGLIYLVLRSNGTTGWNGVPIQTQAGWDRIERAVEKLVRAVLGDRKATGARRSRKRAVR
jgi:AcrR family transcriptional regulator